MIRKGKLYKICRKCESKFIPKGKYCKLCYRCYDKRNASRKPNKGYRQSIYRGKVNGLTNRRRQILKEKYMKKYGLTQQEAIEKVSDFCNELKHIELKMKLKNKSNLEIKLKQQQLFEKEFQSYVWKIDDKIIINERFINNTILYKL